jgi:hypothetical protein
VFFGNINVTKNLPFDFDSRLNAFVSVVQGSPNLDALDALDAFKKMLDA